MARRKRPSWLTPEESLADVVGPTAAEVHIPQGCEVIPISDGVIAPPNYYIGSEQPAISEEERIGAVSPVYWHNTSNATVFVWEETAQHWMPAPNQPLYVTSVENPSTIGFEIVETTTRVTPRIWAAPIGPLPPEPLNDGKPLPSFGEWFADISDVVA